LSYSSESTHLETLAGFLIERIGTYLFLGMQRKKAIIAALA
jgi:hypothetical protein